MAYLSSMSSELHSWFKSLAIVSTEQELRNCLMDNISQHFGVQRWGLYLLDENNELASFDVVGVSNQFVKRYDAIGKSVDPVLKYVLDYHAPAHEGLVLPQGQWKQSQLYQRCCAEHNHEHIMTGPIVGNGSLIGTIHFARVNNTKAFTYDDLSKLGAVCLHVSACLAELRSSPLSIIRARANNNLTPREIQIANLVAQGLTNAEIGKELWITQNTVKQILKKMFSKLNVHSRTAMIFKIRNILDS